MPTRIKPDAKANIKTRVQFEDALNRIAALQLEVEEASATLNAEMAMLQEAAKATIASRQTEITRLLADAERFAEAERDTLFPGKEKTASTALARYGFRLTPPALKALSKAWPAERSIETIRDDGHDKLYLTVKTTLNKDALKAGLDDAGLARYGLRLTSTDEFWLEPIRAAGTPEERLTA